MISFFAFFISLYMYISESVIISESLFQKTAFPFRRPVNYVYPIAYPLIREDCSLQTKFDPVILVSGMAKCS